MSWGWTCSLFCMRGGWGSSNLNEKQSDLILSKNTCLSARKELWGQDQQQGLRIVPSLLPASLQSFLSPAFVLTCSSEAAPTLPKQCS